MLLTESIHFSRYFSPIKQLLMVGLTDVIVKSAESVPSNYIDEPSDSSNVAAFKQLITRISNHIRLKIRSVIKQYIENSLYYIGRHITDDLESIQFLPMRPNGLARDLGIEMNITFINNIKKMIENLVVDHANKSTSIVDFYNEITDKHFVENNLKTNSEIIKMPKIDKMISTLIHELVHVQQHAEQSDRDTNEYRSYLDDYKDEFRNFKRPTEDTDPVTKARYYKLYHASPQELAAFAHNIALNIIIENKLEHHESIDVNSLKSIIVNHILKNNYLFDVPFSQLSYKQRKIFNKYAKRVFDELIDYYTEKEKLDDYSSWFESIRKLNATNYQHLFNEETNGLWNNVVKQWPKVSKQRIDKLAMLIIAKSPLEKYLSMTFDNITPSLFNQYKKDITNIAEFLQDVDVEAEIHDAIKVKHFTKKEHAMFEKVVEKVEKAVLQYPKIILKQIKHAYETQVMQK